MKFDKIANLLLEKAKKSPIVVKSTKGDLKDLLGIPENERLEDHYSSGIQLAKDILKKATGSGEQPGSGKMDKGEAAQALSFMANINPENEIFQTALEILKKYNKQHKKVRKGRLSEVLGLEKGEVVSDRYSSGIDLARDLMKKIRNKKEASQMISFVANMHPELQIYQDALKAISKFRIKKI